MNQLRLGFALLVSVVGIAGAIVALGLSESRGNQDHPTTEQLRTALEPELPDVQSELVADGVLTPEEFEGAIERTAACMEAAGLMVTRQPGQGVGGATHLKVGGDLRTMTREEIGAAHWGCIEKHRGKLDIVWAEMNRPSEDERVAKEHAIDACLTAKGYDYVIPDIPSLVRDPVNGPYPHTTPEFSAYWECHEKYQF